jgi:uncharacterized protein (TIGR03435 family)
MLKRLIWRKHVISLGSATLCMGLLVAIPPVKAQSSTVTSTENVKVPSYDVVSIKPDRTGSGNVGVDIDDGNFDATNISLKNLILSAYGLKEAQLFGLPKWGDSARFDIKAKIVDPDKKALEGLTPEEFESMQRPILTDRFQLKFHHEMKMLPVYDLVTIKGGPKFKEITPAEQKSGVVNGVRAGGMSIHNHNLTATGVPMSSLVNHLSGQVQRVVVDKTGLTANYNLQLSWSADDAEPPSADAPGPPDIFTALEEQLGLKLQPGKADIDTFVIDHVELPSEN